MITVDVASASRYPIDRKVVKRAVMDTLKRNKSDAGDVEVSVSVVGRRKMKVLTDKYLKDDKTHEILSFPFEDINCAGGEGFVNHPDGVLRLGDIILCWPEVVLAASRDEMLVDDEVYFLTTHGVDHLLGKHHE